MKIDTRSMAFVALFAALTAVGAMIRVPLPFTPVPFTLQVFFVLLAGGILGSKLGALSQIVYILLGAIGLPVFAGGSSGFGVILGPTGGYLIGFVPAAFIVGLMMEKREEISIFRTQLVFLTGVLAIYFFGATQLALVANIGPKAAITGGVLPFIPLDIVKAALAALLVTRLKKAIAI